MRYIRPFRLAPHATAHEQVQCAECHSRYSGAAPLDFRCASCHTARSADLEARHTVATSDPAVVVTDYGPTSDRCLRCHADAQVNLTAAHPGGEGTPPHNGATCLTCHDTFRSDKHGAAAFEVEACGGVRPARPAINVLARAAPPPGAPSGPGDPAPPRSSRRRRPSPSSPAGAAP